MAMAIGKRIIQAILTALAATVIVWALLPLSPGDPVMRILEARNVHEPNALQIANLRETLALDRPLPLQYVQWLGGVVQGDLSVSYRTGKPVATEIAERLPATLTLLGTALVVSVLLSLVLAIIAVAWRDRWPDRLIIVYTQIGAAWRGLWLLHFG